MSKFSDRLNEARADETIRAVSRRAAKFGVAESTLHPYFRDVHPRPSMQVVVALAMALGIPSQELRELADIPAEGQPWMPPAEAKFLDDRQRHAIDELIRSIVATKGAANADPSLDTPEPSASAAVDEGQKTVTKLRARRQPQPPADVVDPDNLPEDVAAATPPNLEKPPK